MNVFFNNEKLCQLLLNLYELIGVNTNIFDITGRDIQLIGKHTRFCQMINDDPEGHQRCLDCDRRAVKVFQQRNERHSYLCHAGLHETILPIFDGREVVAYMVFGQMLDIGSRKHQWEFTSGKLDWYKGDKKELQDAFFELPQFSAAKRKAYVETLEAIIYYIQLEGMIRSGSLSDQQKLELYINEHYTEKLSLRSIADALGMGTTKLCALAKCLDPEGSITRLISQRRVEAAKILLRKGNCSIAEIAEKVGFSDYNYFTKIFKKIVGVTPSQYRK